jgi:hypothetical protein
MKKILLTFDYEIYFDGANHFNKLIEHTSRLLDVAFSRKAKLVFFIDILYLVKLEESGQTDAFENVKKQVLQMGEQGHEIQLHYHPHWINAKHDRETDSWTFDRTEYSFSGMIEKYGTQAAISQFNTANSKFIEYFGISSSAFRAGGLSIQNNQDTLIGLLLDNRYIYDSSVMPGLRMKGKYIENDHSGSPGKSGWLIDKKSGFFSETGSGPQVLREIPVMTVKAHTINPLKRVLASLEYRLNGIFSKAPPIRKESGKPIDLEVKESSYPLTITFDKSNLRDIILLKHYSIAYLERNDIMCMLSHPKSFLEPSFFLFDKYLKWVNKQPGLSFAGFNDLN